MAQMMTCNVVSTNLPYCSSCSAPSPRRTAAAAAVQLQQQQRRRSTAIRMGAEESSSQSMLQSVEESEFSGQHPWDPHKPSFSPLLPEAVRPYPAFEGWYTRIVDVARQFSAGVIMATNYATQESQVTLLYSDSPHRTVAIAAKTKEATFSNVEEEDPEAGENQNQPKGFQWEAPGLGKIVMKPHKSEVEVNFPGIHLKVETGHELPWDSHSSEKGPEGWAGKIPLFPCHWYIYSMGSSAKYTFFSSDKNLVVHGDGFAHQEKNWGETFPAGHVWIQGLSADNSAQIVCSGARFNLTHQLQTPFVFALGYRSASQSVNLRSSDLGTVFKDLQINPLEARFSVTGIGPSHTIKLSCSAPADTFSEPILAPVGKLDWKPACRESFVATIEVEVYEHTAWGVVSEEKLIETQIFRCAALEFGEDLLEAAAEEQKKSASQETPDQ